MQFKLSLSFFMWLMGLCVSLLVTCEEPGRSCLSGEQCDIRSDILMLYDSALVSSGLPLEDVQTALGLWYIKELIYSGQTALTLELHFVSFLVFSSWSSSCHMRCMIVTMSLIGVVCQAFSHLHYVLIFTITP